MLPVAKLPDLRALIVADNSLKAMAEAGQDSDIAAALNAPTVTVHRKASNKQLLRWLAGGTRSTKLRAAATDAQNGAKSIAQSALYVVESGLESVDTDAEWWNMVDYLVNAEVLTAEDKTALQDRIAEQIGIAENTLGQSVTADDVSASLAADRPDGRIGGTL